ncbi:MAG: prepilin peptidase [Candidatus Nanohaloarchaea archaeon]
MYLLFSHITVFSILFIASVFDLKTTEVPDVFPAAGIVGGIVLHLMASLPQLNIDTLFSIQTLLTNPVTYFQALGDPLLLSLVVGVVFSIIGWSMYFTNMWGGADAFLLSMIGFGAPFPVSGVQLLYPMEFLFNMVFAGFLYTMVFAVYKAAWRPEVFSLTLKKIEEERKRVLVEVSAVSAFSLVNMIHSPVVGASTFVMFLLLIIVYRFLMVIQEEVMVEEVAVEELEGGEVLGKEEELGGKIKGITEEEIKELDKDEVEIREGIRFVPVFLIAFLITEFTSGFLLLFYLFN